MGRKWKLTKLVVLFALYFFLIIHSSAAGGEGTVILAFSAEDRVVTERTAGSYVLSGSTGVEQNVTQIALLTSMGVRFMPNITIVVPEGTKLAVAIVTNGTTNITYDVLVDGNFTTERFTLERGVHSVEVLVENTTIARWEVQVVSQETRETLQNPQNTEPAGLRRKSALAAALAAAVTVPLGMRLKWRRAREEVL